MKLFFKRFTYWGLLMVFASGVRAETLDSARIQEIAAMLQPQAAGFGQPISDRVVWDDVIARHPEVTNVIALAVEDAGRPLPVQPDSLYLEYSRNGNRTHFQKVAGMRRAGASPFSRWRNALKTRAVSIMPLEQTIAAIGAERTWVLPAHDGKLENFYGKTIEIELDSSYLAAELATANYLLGDRLSPATRNLIRENLERRIFGPYRAAVEGERPEFWWMRGENNWNAVCLCAA